MVCLITPNQDYIDLSRVFLIQTRNDHDHSRMSNSTRGLILFFENSRILYSRTNAYGC